MRLGQEQAEIGVIQKSTESGRITPILLGVLVVGTGCTWRAWIGSRPTDDAQGQADKASKLMTIRTTTLRYPQTTFLLTNSLIIFT